MNQLRLNQPEKARIVGWWLAERTQMNQVSMKLVSIPVDPSDHMMAVGVFTLPREPRGVVLFAQGTGGGRDSSCHMLIARRLHGDGIATLLLDLLTPAEDDPNHDKQIDVNTLSGRLVCATGWIHEHVETACLPIGYFGSCAAGPPALSAAAVLGHAIRAVICVSGRPDLVEASLSSIGAATMLMVGGRDETGVDLNRRAYERLNPPKEMTIVSGAIHPSEERDSVEEVAMLTADWFGRHLCPALKC